MKRKTKNEEIIKQVIETTEMLYYYKNKADNLLHQLNNLTLTRTECEQYASKQRLIEDLESVMY